VPRDVSLLGALVVVLDGQLKLRSHVVDHNARQGLSEERRDQIILLAGVRVQSLHGKGEFFLLIINYQTQLHLFNHCSSFSPLLIYTLLSLSTCLSPPLLHFLSIVLVSSIASLVVVALPLVLELVYSIIFCIFFSLLACCLVSLEALILGLPLC